MPPLTDSELAHLPTDEDVAFYQEHGWFLAPPVLSDEILSLAESGAERLYRGERDRTLPVESGFSDWRPEDGDGVRAAVLYPDGRSVGGAVETIETACRNAGWTVVGSQPFGVAGGAPEATVRALRDADIDVVISLATEPELRAVLEAAAASGWTPWILAPGVLTGALAVDAPASFRDRLVLAYPTLPADREAWALRELLTVTGEDAATGEHVQAAISASAAAAVLTEGLRRAGRGVGRAELLAALESLYRFETGLTPPLTYTSNRRVGANGAWVVVAGGDRGDGRALLETAEWVDLP